MLYNDRDTTKYVPNRGNSSSKTR